MRHFIFHIEVLHMPALVASLPQGAFTPWLFHSWCLWSSLLREKSLAMTQQMVTLLVLDRITLCVRIRYF